MWKNHKWTLASRKRRTNAPFRMWLELHTHALDRMNQEKSRLDSIADDSWYAMGANGASVRYSASVFGRFFRPGSCLEMGPAEGLGTELLVKHFTDLTCVDGAQSFCEALRARYPQYADHRLEDRPVIRIAIERAASWAAER